MSIFFFSWVIAFAIALPAGTLGCFIFWRRLAFFAESLAHSSMLGLAVAFFFSINSVIGILASALCICLFLWVMRRKREFATDAILALTSHVFLGLGIIIINIVEIRVDLLSYLLGEWLSVGKADVIWQSAIGLIVLSGLWLFRKPLLSLTAQEEIADVENWGTKLTDLLFLLFLALFVSVTVQTVGLLLLNTIMIIPAVTMRPWASGPYIMIVGSIIIAIVLLVAGLWLSLLLDLPASPTTAVLGGCLFALSNATKQTIRWINNIR